MKTRKKQNGFGHVEIFVVIVVLALLGFISWKFISGRHDKPVSTPAKTVTKAQPAPAAAAAPKPPILPDGYKRYTDEKLHFSFGYPSTYGTLKVSHAGQNSTDSVQSSLVSDNPNSQSSNGIVGGLSVTIAKPGILETVSRKYGPAIQLKNDTWIVSRENASDPLHYKVGDSFTDFADDIDIQSPVTRGARKVYVFRGSDEGCTSHKYVFVSQNHLIEIAPPSFCDASIFGAGGDSPTAEQFDSNAALLKAILGSIWITK